MGASRHPAPVVPHRLFRPGRGHFEIVSVPERSVMTGTQMRMARAALDWSVRTVAERAQVQRIAVMQLERGKAGHPLTIRAIASAFEAAGIEFLGEDAPGVRLRIGKP